MSKVYRTQTFQNGKKRLYEFYCGHFLVAPYNKDEYVLNHPCYACEIERPIEDNKANILLAYPELKDRLKEPVF